MCTKVQYKNLKKGSKLCQKNIKRKPALSKVHKNNIFFSGKYADLEDKWQNRGC